MKQSIIFLFWFTTFLYAQTSDLIFQNLSSADGLPGNQVSAIFQDHLGFLWFGTDNGLVQYDGYQFEIYQPDDNDPYSISGCDAGQISEDNNGNLWVLITDDGRINKFNRKTKKFNSFTLDQEDSTSQRYKGIFQFYLDSAGDLWTVTLEGKLDKINTETGDIKHYHDILNDTTNLSSSIVSAYAVGGLRRSALYEDSEGMMWIGTSGGGLYRYHRESDSFFNYKHDPSDPYSISCDSVSSIFEDSQKDIWICTRGGGLNRYSRKTNTFINYRHKTDDPLSIGSDFCYKILEDKSNKLWVALENGLDCFDQKNGVFTHHYRHDPKDPNLQGRGNRFLPIYEDKTGFIWILVQGRLNQIDRYDPQTGRTFNYLEDYNNPKSIIGRQFGSFLEDHTGSFWMGTLNRGVIKFDPFIQNFKNYKHNPGNNNSLSQNQIDAIIESKSQPGVIWIGTQDGLNKYDKGTETFTRYRHDPNNSNSLINNQIMSLIEDESGLLWVSTNPMGFSSFDAHSGRFKHYNYSPESSHKKLVKKLYQDHSGTIWLAEIGRGLIRFDKSMLTFTRHMLNRQAQKSWDNSVQCMYEDKEGSLWISTVAGLKKYLRQQQTFTHSLLNDFIRAIYEDSSNQLWLGSIYNGLALFDRSTGEATYYNQDHGLANNEVRSIIEDDHGNLWLATAGGLSRFNPQTRIFTNFYTQHGLPSNIFQVGTGIKTSDGEILVGTLDNGMVAFNPDDIEINTIPPKLVISDIKLFNKSLAIGSNSPLKQNISVTKEIHFAHWQNDISLECATLHFSYPQKNKYAYWLENYEKDWNFAGTNRVAVYTNLDPGKYIFHVKGANSDNVWNEEYISLRIVIHPPWWETWWAYLMYTLIFMFMITVVYVSQRKRIRIVHELEIKDFETKKLKEVDAMKSKFFANISHEFRTPLTLIKGPIERLLAYDKASDRRKSYKLIKRNSERLLNLINELLDLSKLESGKMKLSAQRGDIVSFTKAIVMSFESLAKKKGIQIDISSSIDLIELYFDKEKMQKILSNILSNAFKFTTEDDKITVSIEEDISHRTVIIEIADSGIGIPQEEVPKIFDRFHQVENTKTEGYEGTGIGLSLTKELVEIHHGTITVKSEEGKGSTFTLTFHLGTEYLEEEELIYSESEMMLQNAIIEDNTSVSSNVEEEKPLLLIVEDNKDVREFIISIIENKYRYYEAVDGKEGYEKALEQMPDLIVSDIMMPKLTGDRMCERLKNDQITSHIPIVLLTAKSSGEDKINGLEIGADDYLIKPFNEKELLARINNLIAQRRKLREKYLRDAEIRPTEVAVTSVDKKFIEKLMQLVEENIPNPEFHVEQLADLLAMSRTQLNRKISSILGQKPNEFIRKYRIRRAAELIKQNFGNMTDVAYEVGFDNLSYFSKCFKQIYKQSPLEFEKNFLNNKQK